MKRLWDNLRAMPEHPVGLVILLCGAAACAIFTLIISAALAVKLAEIIHR